MPRLPLVLYMLTVSGAPALIVRLLLGTTRIVAGQLRHTDSHRPIKANPLTTIRHVTSYRLGLLLRSVQGASEAVGSRCRVPVHRAGGLPKALRALRTIFLPASRLPTAPMPAPIPTGRTLPNSNALRFSV